MIYAYKYIYKKYHLLPLGKTPNWKNVQKCPIGVFSLGVFPNR